MQQVVVFEVAPHGASWRITRSGRLVAYFSSMQSALAVAESYKLSIENSGGEARVELRKSQRVNSTEERRSATS